MEPIVKKIQPFYLPQVTAPYKFLSSELTKFGVAHEPITIAVWQLNPIQKEVDMNKLIEISKVPDEKLKPIFLSRKLDILDGHHRSGAKKYKEGKNGIIKAIRIDASKEDGCAYLKLIQDRWERSQENK